MVTINLRTVRRDFSREFSPTTSKIVALIAKGKPTKQIATKLSLPLGTVSATKANLTRGVYAPFAFVSLVKGVSVVIGDCQF